MVDTLLRGLAKVPFTLSVLCMCSKIPRVLPFEIRLSVILLSKEVEHGEPPQAHQAPRGR